MATTLKQNKVEIAIKGKRTNALLDTGASLTVASSAFIQKTRCSSASLQPPTHPIIRGVTGARLHVLGVLTIPISIGGLAFSHPFQVIQHFDYPLILSVDFLNENKASIDFASQQLILPDEHSMTHSVV